MICLLRLLPFHMSYTICFTFAQACDQCLMVSFPDDAQVISFFGEKKMAL